MPERGDREEERQKDRQRGTDSKKQTHRHTDVFCCYLFGWLVGWLVGWFFVCSIFCCCFVLFCCCCFFVVVVFFVCFCFVWGAFKGPQTGPFLSFTLFWFFWGVVCLFVCCFGCCCSSECKMITRTGGFSVTLLFIICQEERLLFIRSFRPTTRMLLYYFQLTIISFNHQNEQIL